MTSIGLLLHLQVFLAGRAEVHHHRGAAVVASIISLASAGTACIIAGVASAVIAAWVGYLYNPRCWVEVKVTYGGSVAGGNSCWKVA